MLNQKLHFQNIRTKSDIYCVSELFARCFAENNSYFQHLENTVRQLEKNPGFNPLNVWFYEKNGEIAGHVFIITYPIRIGRAVLEMGGIGNVCTLPAYRQQGYNRILLTHCLEHIQKIGMDISLLDGIPNYYHKFEYTVVMPKYKIEINSPNTFTLDSSYKIRKFKAADLPALISLFQKEYAAINGIHERSTEYWEWLIAGEPEIYVAVDLQNSVRGYIWLIGKKVISIKEAAGQDVQAISGLLKFTGEEAQKRFQPQLSGSLHPEQPFARYALHRCSASIKIQYQNNSGWMGRIINLTSLFQKLAVEFSHRLQTVDWQGKPAVICFETGAGNVNLQIAPSRVSLVTAESKAETVLCRLSQSTLLQMIYGYLSVEELIGQGRVEVEPAQLPLLKALFPKKLSFLSKPDYF